MTKFKPVTAQTLPQPGRPHLFSAPPTAPALPHAEVFRNAALSIPNGFAFTNLPFDSFDTTAVPASGAFNTTTGIFTCLLPGRYLVSCFVIFNAAGSYTVGLELLRNGANYKRIASGANANGNAAANGDVVAQALTMGTTFQIQVAQNSATNPAPLFVGSELCYCSFEYLGPLL